MDSKYCVGCYNNVYANNGRTCWYLKHAKLVWRIRVGNWEDPKYYKNKKKVRVPACYYTGPGGDKFIEQI